MPSPLQFRPDNRFRIAQLTDLHWANGGDEDIETQRLTELVLDREKPDLVVLTGDVIAGGDCLDPADSWLRAVRPMEERGILWAAVYGNHDDEGSLNRTQLMAVQRSCRCCLSESGPEEITGVGNYILTVQTAGSDEIGAVLYFLDSNSYAKGRFSGYGWFERDQIAWYLATAGRFTRNRTAPSSSDASIPALAFFHIPLPEFDDVWDFEPCYGHKYEAVSCPRINTGMFAAFCEAGDVMGVFVGHDHINDYEGTWHGIRLCLGRAGGYGTYGREGFPRGARIIELCAGERQFSTWLLLDDGSEVRHSPLHEPEGRILKRKTMVTAGEQAMPIIRSEQ